MALPAALTMTLALAAASGGDRLLLCRPELLGDPALARGDAVAAAASASRRFLDYGVVCEGPAEGARAARRVGLGHAVSASAEGRVEGSRYVLVVADAATEAERGRRTLEVAPGADAVRPLRAALDELVRELPAPERSSRASRLAAWGVAGAGAVALAAGAVLTLRAREAADRAGAAPDLGAHVRARDEWERRRTAAAVLLASGGAALGGGLAWRFAF